LLTKTLHTEPCMIFLRTC